jgi:tetratricopeptide (TPR) repeat protein
MNETENPNLESVVAEVKELKQTIEFQKELNSVRIDMQKELSSIRKDFSDLKTEVKVESNFYKWIGASGVFVAVVLGALGMSQWNEVISKLHSKVDQTSEYQSDLVRGLALANGKHPQDAIKYLAKCYESTPGNEAVAATLLESYQNADEWEKAVPVANKFDALGIDTIQNAWVLDNVGMSLMYQGRDDLDKRKKAKIYLDRAAEKLEGDSEERDVWENLWVYHLFTGNIPEAERSLRHALVTKSTKPPRTNAADWRNENEWSLFQFLQKKNTTMSENMNKTVSDVLPARKR